MADAHPSLSSLPYTIESQIYSTPYECAFNSRDLSTHYPLLMIVRSYPSEQRLRSAIDLLTKHSSVKDERLLEYKIHNAAQRDDSTFELAIVLEWSEKTLYSEISDRAASRIPYSESYLRTEVNGLVQALARLQNQGIAHMNITPMSIFLTPIGLKLGLIDPPMTSGQEFYLPPAQRFGLLRPEIPLFENAYKSGVYMLATCVMSMALLREPQLTKFSNLEEEIGKELQNIQLSTELVGYLRSMLSVHDLTRPDFKFLSQSPLPEQVDGLTTSGLQEGCLQCGKSADSAERWLPLWCNVQKHGFCCWKCAELYIVAATNRFTLDISSVYCNRCSQPIHGENLAECVGGQNNLTRLRDETLYDKPICCSCRRLGEETFRLECGCYFCLGDLRTASQNYYKSKVCIGCGGKISNDQLRSIIFRKK